MTDDAPLPPKAEIDEIPAEFGGDDREAIAALPHDLATLAADSEAAVSRGFVGGLAPASRHSKSA